MLDGKLRRTAAIAPFLIAGVAALAAPLAHQDLPSHVRIGEWILDHGSVPFLEPVAWTRAGEPYFAYSWLAQVLFAGAWRAGGAFGLHLVHAALTLAAGFAVIAFGRAEQWTAERTSIVVTLHVAALALTVPSLRPQMVLFIAVPLVAAGVSRLVRHGMHLKAILIILAGSSLAANTHLFFPLTLAPLAWAWVNGVRRRRVALFAMPIFAGWLLSPYALSWVDVFRLNFAPNAMLARGSPIAEIASGFTQPNVAALIVLAAALALTGVAFASTLTASAHEVPIGRASLRLSVAAGALLVVVTAFYALAVRLIVAGWLILLPFVSAGVGMSDRRYPASTRFYALVFLIVAVAWPSRWSGWTDAGVAAPGVDAPWDRAIGTLALHLRCSGLALEDTRVFTRFAEGSYLSWALSPAMMSVDTRTIFPDSVARAERAVMLGGRDMPQLGPWRDAHLVILRTDDPAASAVERDSGWMPIARTSAPSGRGGQAWAAWARQSWLARSTPVPYQVVEPRPVDPRREDCPGPRLIAADSRALVRRTSP